MRKLNAGKYASKVGVRLPLVVNDSSSLMDYLRLFISSVCETPFDLTMGTLLNIVPRSVVVWDRLPEEEKGPFNFTLSAKKGLPTSRYDLAGRNLYPEEYWVTIDETSPLMPSGIMHLLVAIGFGEHLYPKEALKDPLYRYKENEAPQECCYDCRSPSMHAVDFDCGSKVWNKIKPVDSETLYGELCLTCAVNRIQAYNRLNPKDSIHGASFSVTFN